MEKTKLSQIIILVSVFVLGIVLGAIIGSTLIKETAYNQGLTEGKKQIEEKYQRKIAEIFPSFPEEEEIFEISGSITKIEDKTLFVEVDLPVYNPFQELKTEQKLVKITDSTELVKLVEKSQEEFIKEEEAFMKAIEEGKGTEVLPPLHFKEEAVEFTELKVGDEISAESEENIKDKDEFFAEKIVLQLTLSE